jgi:hypothetical protein
MFTPLRVCLFVGPSVPPAELQAACATIDAEVQVLPPIQQGDLLRLLPNLPDVIGIVDGYFHQVPAVLHKEILAVLECGARVLGAASMGALRAAELDEFGMEGIGEIYRLYRQGALDGDDEVAVLHAEADEAYRPLGEALVNVRHILTLARRQRVISAATARAVLANAKRLCFIERSYAALLDPGRVVAPAGELAVLREFVRSQRVDLKRADALELVRTVAERVRGAQPWPRTFQPSVNRTKFLHDYERQYVGRTAGGSSIPDAMAVAFEALLSPSFPALFRRVRLRSLAVDEARTHGLTAEAPDRLIERFAQARQLRSEMALTTWLRRHDVTRAELAASLREFDLERQILSRFVAPDGDGCLHESAVRRMVNEVARRLGIDRVEGVDINGLSRRLLPGIDEDAMLVRELKLQDRFRPVLDHAVRVLDCHAAYSRRRPAFKLWRLPRETIDQWFADRWGVGQGAAFDEALLERGFADHAAFLEPARLAYLYGRVGGSNDVGESGDVTAQGVALPPTPGSHLTATGAHSAA